MGENVYATTQGHFSFQFSVYFLVLFLFSFAKKKM